MHFQCFHTIKVYCKFSSRFHNISIKYVKFQEMERKLLLGNMRSDSRSIINSIYEKGIELPPCPTHDIFISSSTKIFSPSLSVYMNPIDCLGRFRVSSKLCILKLIAFFVHSCGPARNEIVFELNVNFCKITTF